MKFKISAIVFFCILSPKLNAQFDAEGLNCDGVQDSFQRDLDSGIVRFFEPGGINPSNTLEQLLEERYGIIFIETNRYAPSTFQACYNHLSWPYIKEHFGDTVIYQAKRDANYLDTTGQGDHAPIYTTPVDSVTHFFASHIDPVFYMQYMETRSHQQIRLYMVSDSTGKLTSVHVGGFTHLPLQEEFNKLVDEFPYLAIPATDDGNPVAGATWYTIYFNEETAKLYQGDK